MKRLFEVPTLAIWFVLFLTLKCGNCQVANETLEIVDETPLENTTEIEPTRTCSGRVHTFLLNTTRTLWEEEFLPDQTLTMKNYVEEKLTIFSQQIREEMNEKLEDKNEQIRTLEDKVSQQNQKILEMEANIKVCTCTYSLP